MISSAQYVWDLCKVALCDAPGAVVMLRVYMDESGTHDGSPAVTVGAYCGFPKNWKDFTREWNVAKKPIGVFHSTDCAALRGEFKGWTEEQRDKYVANLLPILSRHNLRAVAIGINTKDYSDAIQAHFPLEETFGSAYEVCFQVVVDNVIYQMEQSGMNDALAFVHEENDYQREALAAFEYIKRKRKKHASKMTITFASKDRAVPLQAADVLAFEANKRLRDQSRRKRRSLIAMDPKGDRVHIAGIDKSNVAEILARLQITQKEISLLGRPISFLRD